MVSVGVAASVWLGAGRVGATSSISRALGSMPCHAGVFLYSWYTYRRLWYTYFFDHRMMHHDALKMRKFYLKIILKNLVKTSGRF